jgi:hypothetical protein
MTITRWENNAVRITKKQLDKLINTFKLHYLIVEQEWLLTGNGISPINLNASDINKLNFDEISYKNLNSLKTEIKDFEIYQVNSNFFSPIINYADYIAGIIYVNKKSLLGKLTFAITDGFIHVGVFDYLNNALINFSNEKFILQDSSKLGEVLWAAKRF